MKTIEMFAGVDGTGVYNDVQYRKDFQNSFVKRFCDMGPGVTRFYHRGPGMDGFVCHSQARLLYQHAKAYFEACYAKEIYLKIMLAGYSRGGVSASAAANMLNRDGIPVHGLFLLDPVDRSLTIWGNDTIVQKNVNHVYRTQRAAGVSSRESFDTDCLKYWDGRKIETHEFYTTHGGMGGCPWGAEFEAEYYNLSTISKVNGLKDGYYSDAPPGGEVDYTKPRVIYEGGLDGATMISADREAIGHDNADKHLQLNIANIRRQPPCMNRLKVYQDVVATKERQRDALRHHRQLKASGRTWPTYKM